MQNATITSENTLEATEPLKNDEAANNASPTEGTQTGASSIRIIEASDVSRTG